MHMNHTAKLLLVAAVATPLATACHADLESGSASWEIICSSSETRLMAGQSIDVGTVEVTQDETLLCVTFDTTGTDWYITENHLALAGTVEELPQTGSGNPQVGQFPYSRTNLDTQTDTHCVDYVAAGYLPEDAVYLAAHAVVELRDGSGTAVQTETAWGEGPEFSGRSWAMYFDYALESCHQECPATVTTASAADMLYMPDPRSYALEEYHLADCATVSYDSCSGDTDIDVIGNIVSISSDEPVLTANHDCNAEPEACIDIVIVDNSTFQVRNQRDSYGDGRVYTVNFTVNDGTGSSTVYSCEIGVRLYGGHIPTAGPAAYTVTP